MQSDCQPPFRLLPGPDGQGGGRGPSVWLPGEPWLLLPKNACSGWCGSLGAQELSHLQTKGQRSGRVQEAPGVSCGQVLGQPRCSDSSPFVQWEPGHKAGLKSISARPPASARGHSVVETGTPACESVLQASPEWCDGQRCSSGQLTGVASLPMTPVTTGRSSWSPA